METALLLMLLQQLGYKPSPGKDEALMPPLPTMTMMDFQIFSSAMEGVLHSGLTFSTIIMGTAMAGLKSCSKEPRAIDPGLAPNLVW
jgi:hypothetical protein